MARIRKLIELQQHLRWLKNKCEKSYGYALWDVRCQSDLLKAEVFITGWVLLPSQKYAAQKAAASILKGRMKYHCEIEVLADINSDRQITWGLPRIDVLNVYSRPREYSSLKSTRDRFLSSQVVAEDHSFRIIFEHKGWLLIQLADFTIGWVQTELVDVANMKGAQIRISLNQAESDKALMTRYRSTIVVERAREYLRTPYVLGGVTKLGLDCSGLVQRAYKDALGITLPKHSRDQMLVGQSVSFSRRQPSDLIFFSRKGNRDLHVGLIHDKDRVIHASGRHGSVTIDGLSTLPSLLDIIQLRRVVSA